MRCSVVCGGMTNDPPRCRWCGGREFVRVLVGDAVEVRCGGCGERDSKRAGEQFSLDLNATRQSNSEAVASWRSRRLLTITNLLPERSTQWLFAILGGTRP